MEVVMTAHEMNLKAIGLMQEDPADISLLTQYNTALLIGFNTGYREIVDVNLQVTCWDRVVLDADKRVFFSDLTYTPNEILAVTQYQDYTATSNFEASTRYPFKTVDGEFIVVPAAAALGSVYVLYRPIPDDLVNPVPTTGVGSTSPLYISTQKQIALVYKGISELKFSEGNQADGVMWDRKYQAEAYGIRPLKRQTAVKSTYGY